VTNPAVDAKPTSIQFALHGQPTPHLGQEEREKAVLTLPSPKGELDIDHKHWSQIKTQNLPVKNPVESFHITEDAEKITSLAILSLFHHQGEAKRHSLPPVLKGCLMTRPSCQPNVNSRRIIDHRRIHNPSDKKNPGVLGYLLGHVPNSHPEDL
jgi:hypothetical protein